MEVKFAEEVLKYGTGPIILVVIGILVFLKYYDKIKLLISDIWFCLASVCSCFQKKAIKSNIEARAAMLISEFDKICPELALPLMSVSWIKDKEVDSLFNADNNQTIVLVRYNQDNSQNVINATMAYVKSSLLPAARPYVENKLMSAIDYSFILNFLGKSEHHDVLVSKYVIDNRDDILKNSERISCVKAIDDVGLFSRILLREYSVWGAKILGTPILEEHAKESLEFMEFLYNIVTREVDDYTPLQFCGMNIKVGVLLVAKPDTYFEAGAAPYLRRIKEGFANGIRTYYLLARNEKIEILHDVYSELILSGNFELKNGPIVYRDKERRPNICYCIEVVDEGEISTTVKELNNVLESKQKIEATVSQVREEQLWCYYKGIEIVVPLKNVTSFSEVNLREYYHKGSLVQMYVEERDTHGRFIGSFLNTESNPESLISANYSIGNIVQCIVEFAEDEFIKTRIKNDDIECIAFRKNLTYSHFQYLHQLFPIGSEHTFVIENINFIKRSFELKLANLIDPWETLHLYVGQAVDCRILQKLDTCYKTELQDGVLGIIPKSELSWFEENPNAHRLNEILNCKIKVINKERRCVILSVKPQENPYEVFFNNLNSESKVFMQIKEENSRGISGLISGRFNVFIPLSELHIGKSYFNYQIGKSYQIDVLRLTEDARCFIGSFKRFIENPLKKLEALMISHEVVEDYKIVKSTDNRVVMKAVGRNSGEEFDAVLFASELTKFCFVKQLDAILANVSQLPMCVLAVDYMRNNLILSHKEYVAMYSSEEELKYGEVYSGYIIGCKNYNEKVILVDKLWIHGILESERKLKIGTKIDVIVTSKGGAVSVFSEVNSGCLG